MNSQLAISSRLSPSPDTCWLSPSVTANSPISAPATTPDTMAATSPTRPSRCAAPPGSRRMPRGTSSPRCRGSGRHRARRSARSAHTSGVAIVSMAPTSASRLMLIRRAPSLVPGRGAGVCATGRGSAASSSPRAPRAAATRRTSRPAGAGTWARARRSGLPPRCRRAGTRRGRHERAESAEGGHDDAGVAVVVADAGGQLVLDPITCEAPPSPATAPDTSAQRNCSRPTAMPLKSAALQGLPGGTDPDTGRRTAQHDAGHHDHHDREPEAPVHAAVRQQGGQVVAGTQTVRSVNPLSELRHGPLSRPWTTRRATGLSSNVVTTSSIPNFRFSQAGTTAQSRPPSAPATKPSGRATTAGRPGSPVPTAVVPMAPSRELSLGPDVPVAGAESDGHRQHGERQRRRRQQDIVHARDKSQRRDRGSARTRPSGWRPPAGSGSR